MGLKQSRQKFSGRIAFPEIIDLKFQDIKEYGGLVYVTFTPKKTIRDDFYRFHFSRNNQGDRAKIFDIYLRDNFGMYTVEGKKMKHFTLRYNDNDKLTIKTGEDNTLLSIVYRLGKKSQKLLLEK